MPAKKSKTPMTRAQRFAKYAAKMTEANQEQWSSKMKEKRANYLARMSEQQKDAMRKRDKAKREAAKMAPNMKPVEMYRTSPTISILNLLSDGAGQHFKQSFFFNAVTHLPKLMELTT